MKIRKGLLLIITFFCMAIIGILSKEVAIEYIGASIIYGQKNNSKIIFSKESGFYDEEFELSIYAPTKEIYYTLDGSEPDRSSLKYIEPIKVKDATHNPNTYSMREDTTTEFLDEELEKYSKERRRVYYKTPDYKIDKCTIIKVVYYDEKGEKSRTEERNYFVDFDEKTGYENINIISISTDPANLFDYEDGIYVLGNTYDQFREEVDMEEYWAREYWYHWDANYRNRGIDWERESRIHVYNDDKELVLSQNIGIRIQGGGSRGFLPKSLNIYARDEYGENRLYYNFFNTGYYPKRVTLTTGGDDYYLKIKDRLVSELAKNTNVVTMNYEPYVLFLNGEYWGFYYLTEKYDEIFIENYYGVDKGETSEDIIIVKDDNLETGKAEDLEELYMEAIKFIAESDLRNEKKYQQACELMDIESCIDYFAVLGYAGRSGDWPHQNYALWRSRNISEKKYEDGKWRYMIFDVNSTSMELGMVDHDLIGELRQYSAVFNSLCDNDTFKKQFVNRLLELADTIYAQENIERKLSEYTALMEKPMENHYRRFWGTGSEKFSEGVEEIRQFYSLRKEYVIESIRTHFGEEYLGGTIQ